MTEPGDEVPYRNLPALSVRQPWAELILQRRKCIEVRTWTTDYRGRVWLHAGQQVDDAASEHFQLTRLFTGGLVGMVTLTDIVPLDEGRWEQWRSMHCIPGPAPFGSFAWMLADAIRLREPLLSRGRLGLFRLDQETQARLQDTPLERPQE